MEPPALLATLTTSATMTTPPAGTPPTLPSELCHFMLSVKFLVQVWCAHLRLSLGSGHLCCGLHGLLQSPRWWQGGYCGGDRSLKSQVRFVLWTGDDTVHCDDAYSDKNTVSKSRPRCDHENEVCFKIFDHKVIEIISSLSQQLNKTGLPVLPVQVGRSIFK